MQLPQTKLLLYLIQFYQSELLIAISIFCHNRAAYLNPEPILLNGRGLASLY